MDNVVTFLIVSLTLSCAGAAKAMWTPAWETACVGGAF